MVNKEEDWELEKEDQELEKEDPGLEKEDHNSGGRYGGVSGVGKGGSVVNIYEEEQA